ncbi:hypothetical protein KFU94_68965 [Chloroflexi bacterium TSY]|nr:hypothetical protein [Chloroflexi bacterium TSY]
MHILKEIAIRFKEPCYSGSELLAAQHALSKRRPLLILDSAEYVDDLGPLLELRTNRGWVIITSTSKHDVVGKTYEVGVLPPTTARTLIEDWSEGIINDEIADKICHLIGYLPLAIRIAGHRVRLGSITATECLKELEDSDLIFAQREGNSIR